MRTKQEERRKRRPGARRLLAALSAAALMLTLSPQTPDALTEDIPVALPSFPVTLGGERIESENEEYPILVRDGTPYLPLTYYACRLLGLYARWTPETGLTVSDIGAAGDYIVLPLQSSNDGALYAAVIPDGTITLRGTVLDAAALEEPLLLFRNATYLPMTREIMETCLDCRLTFDAAAGLTVSRAEETRGSAVYLPLYRDADDYANIAAWDGWFWFEDSDGWISRAPMSGGPIEKLLALPSGPAGGAAHAAFRLRGDALFAALRTDGGDGEELVVRLRADGGLGIPENPEELSVGSGSLRVTVDQSASARPGNLSRDGAALGSPDYLYGWACSYDGGMSASERLVVRDGAVYVLGIDAPGASEGAASVVCRVDLVTGETEELTGPASDFQLTDTGELWYVSAETGALIRRAEDGEAVMSRPGLAVEDFWVGETDGAPFVCYTVPRGGGDVWLCTGGTLWEEPFHEARLEDGCLIALFDDDGSGAGLRLGVFRADGMIYSVSGVDILSAGIRDGKLCYVLK